MRQLPEFEGVQDVKQYGPYKVYRLAGIVATPNGKRVDLTPRLMDIFLLLGFETYHKMPDIIKQMNEIKIPDWNSRYYKPISRNNVQVLIKHLRRKLGDDAVEKDEIEGGYRLNAHPRGIID